MMKCSPFMTDENRPADKNQDSRPETWLRLRGIAKDIYADYGGGEAYRRKEREAFNRGMERREDLIAEAMGLSPNKAEIAKAEIAKDES
jgi:hypothetical protein